MLFRYSLNPIQVTRDRGKAKIRYLRVTGVIYKNIRLNALKHS